MTETERAAFVIGSRGSRLARWQAEHVASFLGPDVEIRIIKTSGDLFLDRPLQGQDTKGFFTKEIEEELLDGRIDLAVHSLKDLPTQLPPGLTLAVVSRRAAVADLLLVRPERVDAARPFPVADGAVVGATSLRRQAMLRRFAPHVGAAMLRGNVPTRVDKLKRGDYDAIILAAAGVERLTLDLSGLAAFELNPRLWLPAPGQAALGIETRENDARIRAALAAFHDETAWRAVRVERELLNRFEGGCHVAFAAFAEPKAQGMTLAVGVEDEAGRWLAVRVEADGDEAAQEAAWDKLMRVVKTGHEEDDWERALCRERRPSS